MELVMIGNDRAAESSDDGDSKQFIILLLGIICLFGNTQKKWQQTPSAMVTACEVDRLLVSIMKIVILYTFVKP